MSIGEKIKNIRKSMNITQQELAGKEFTKGYISQIENGTVEPSTKALKIISNRLGKPISYFLDDNNRYKDDLEKIENQFIIGENLFLQKKYRKALEIFKEVIENNVDFSNTIHISSKLYIGKCLWYLDKYNESFEVLIDIISLIKRLGIFKKLIDAYFFIGLCYFDLKDYEKAIIYFKKGLTVIEEQEIQLEKQKALLLLNTATAYMNMGNLAIALNYFDTDLAYCKNNKITDTLLDCYVRKAYIYYKLEKYKESKNFISKAISLNNSLDYDMLKAEIYNILGMVIAKEGRVEQAFKLLDKSMEISKRINYKLGYYINVVEWINILIENKRVEEAKKMIDDYFDEIKKLKNKNIVYKLYGQLGHINMLKKNYNEGKQGLIKAIEGLLKENMKHDAAKYSKILAEAIINIEPEEAKKYYNLSIRCLSELNNCIIE